MRYTKQQKRNDACHHHEKMIEKAVTYGQAVFPRTKIYILIRVNYIFVLDMRMLKNKTFSNNGQLSQTYIHEKISSICKTYGKGDKVRGRSEQKQFAVGLFFS